MPRSKAQKRHGLGESPYAIRLTHCALGREPDDAPRGLTSWSAPGDTAADAPHLPAGPRPRRPEAVAAARSSAGPESPTRTAALAGSYVTLWGAGLALEAAALLGSAAAARRERSFRPLAALLLAAVLGDVVMQLLYPYACRGGVALHVHRAVMLAWPATLAGVTGRIFASTKGERLRVQSEAVVALRDSHPRSLPLQAPRFGVRRVALVLRPPLAVKVCLTLWALTSVLLPFAPAGTTLPLLHAAHGLAVVVAGVAAARAWRRTWGQAHAAVLLLVCSELVCVTVGPWVDRPAASWAVAQAVYCAGFGVLVLSLWGVPVGALLVGGAVAVVVEPVAPVLRDRIVIALVCSALALSLAGATVGWQRVALAEGRVSVRHRVGRALAALLHGR